MQKYTAVIAVLCITCLCGCESAELEQRSFPLAMGIDVSAEQAGKGLVVSYDFPDLNQISEKSKTSDTPMEFSLEGEDLYQIEKSYENNTNRILDYNHLKSVILGEENFQNMNMLRGILEKWEGQQGVARNTSLFLTKGRAAQIFTLTEETEGSIGKYLEEMLESQKDFRQEKIAAIGDLMNQWHNQDEVLLVPVLTEQGERPAVTGYGVISNFQYTGNITVEEAMQVFLSQNMLKRFQCECDDGTVVEITGIQVRKEITEEGDIPVVTVSVEGKGRILQPSGTDSRQQYQVEQQIEQQLEFGLTKTGGKIQKELGVDMTNSYIALGGHNRKLYEKYRNMPESYGKTVQQVFQAEIKILSRE